MLSFAKILGGPWNQELGHCPSAQIVAMIPLLRHFFGWLVGAFRSREDLMLRTWHCGSNCWFSMRNDLALD